MRAWDIIQNGRIIDTVFYDRTMTLHEVRASLIHHDGHGVDIQLMPAV
jgi:hypothetical protein